MMAAGLAAEAACERLFDAMLCCEEAMYSDKTGEAIGCDDGVLKLACVPRQGVRCDNRTFSTWSSPPHGDAHVFTCDGVWYDRADAVKFQVSTVLLVCLLQM